MTAVVESPPNYAPEAAPISSVVRLRTREGHRPPHLRVRVCLCMCMCVYRFMLYVNMHCVHVCVCMYVCACMRVNISTYIHTHK